MTGDLQGGLLGGKGEVSMAMIGAKNGGNLSSDFWDGPSL